MDNELVHTVLLHFNLLSLSLSLSLSTNCNNELAGSEAQLRSHPYKRGV